MPGAVASHARDRPLSLTGVVIGRESGGRRQQELRYSVYLSGFFRMHKVSRMSLFIMQSLVSGKLRYIRLEIGLVEQYAPLTTFL